jgi:pseudaminic acid cytidylyltransferase
MANIAIIPARGGSKRIPRKNVRSLYGKPAISYPIELAIRSGIFERIIVSTEDQEIAEVAIDFGAEVPFLREAKLSDDDATTLEVISDSAEKLKLPDSDFICCIYPVTPLLELGRLLQAYEVLLNGTWDYVFPACEYTTPIERGFKRNSLGQVQFLVSEFISAKTQSIEKTYYDAGQFYFGKAQAWKNKLPLLDGNSTFIELGRHEVIDVDQEEDWNFVEKLMELNRRKNHG